ncbi:MAG: prolipoprotein diacylglyceryl transferase [Puniceicoccales bacterium]|jgi:phosphatidylglycerol:prolipoprotein diacylglycerol transferase|nr:prolipoprotein diacylglyceryl transferase [Puniceicoccales bacterium]
MILGYITVNIDPFAIHFPESWGIGGIRWYGICYVINFFLVQFFLTFYSRRKISSLTSIQNDALLLYVALGVVIGGRLGHCLLYNWEIFSTNPLIFFQVWRGGMASHGGFVGVILAILYFARKFHCDTFCIADIICSIIPLCLMVGRLGNFVNGELIGRITNVPWGIIYGHGLGLLVRHPSSLYEAFFEGFLPFIVLQVIIWRKNFRSGQLSGLFLILYSMGRIGCEYFREPDAGLIFGMTRGQFFSIFLFLLGIILLFYLKSVGRRGKLHLLHER